MRIWYSRNSQSHKFRQLYTLRSNGIDPNFNWLQLTDGQFRRLTPQEKAGRASAQQCAA
jgi:hypothetical protein